MQGVRAELWCLPSGRAWFSLAALTDPQLPRCFSQDLEAGERPGPPPLLLGSRGNSQDDKISSPSRAEFTPSIAAVASLSLVTPNPLLRSCEAERGRRGHYHSLKLPSKPSEAQWPPLPAPLCPVPQTPQWDLSPLVEGLEGGVSGAGGCAGGQQHPGAFG